jgi:hypothetical protein
MFHCLNLLSDICNVHTENIGDITDDLIMAIFSESHDWKKKGNISILFCRNLKNMKGLNYVPCTGWITGMKTKCYHRWITEKCEISHAWITSKTF